MLFAFKQKNIKPSRCRYDKQQKDNKKVTTRKLPVTNNKVFICTISLILPALFKEIPSTNYKLLVCIDTGKPDNSLVKQPRRTIGRTCRPHKNVD